MILFASNFEIIHSFRTFVDIYHLSINGTNIVSINSSCLRLSYRGASCKTTIWSINNYPNISTGLFFPSTKKSSRNQTHGCLVMWNKFDCCIMPGNNGSWIHKKCSSRLNHIQYMVCIEGYATINNKWADAEIYLVEFDMINLCI